MLGCLLLSATLFDMIEKVSQEPAFAFAFFPLFGSSLLAGSLTKSGKNAKDPNNAPETLQEKQPSRLTATSGVWPFKRSLD